MMASNISLSLFICLSLVFSAHGDGHEAPYDPRDYCVAFIDPIRNPDDSNQHLVLMPGVHGKVNVTVTSGDGSLNEEFQLDPLTPRKVYINESLLTRGGVEQKGIKIHASAHILIYANNARMENADVAFVVRMREAFTDFVIPSFTCTGVVNSSVFTVVAGHDNTEVNVTTHNGDGCNGASAKTTTYTINAHETLTECADVDLTGTCVSASKPVAVFGGSTSAFVPATGPLIDPLASHLYEQILPTVLLGTEHTLPDFISRTTAGDTYRVIASEDATTVMVYIGDQPVMYKTSLQKGQFHQFSTGTSNSGHVTCSAPCMVVMYNARSDIDGDPTAAFMIAIPPNTRMIPYVYPVVLDNYEDGKFDTYRFSLTTKVSASINETLNISSRAVPGSVNYTTLEGDLDTYMLGHEDGDNFMFYLHASSANNGIGTHAGFDENVDYCAAEPCLEGQNCTSYCRRGVTSGCDASINDGFICMNITDDETTPATTDGTTASPENQGLFIVPANILAYANGKRKFVYEKEYFEHGGLTWPRIGTPMVLPLESHFVAMKFYNFRRHRLNDQTMGVLAAFTEETRTHSGQLDKWRCIAANKPPKMWYKAEFDDSQWEKPVVRADHPGAMGSGYEDPFSTRIQEASSGGAKWIWAANWNGKQTQVYCRVHFT